MISLPHQVLYLPVLLVFSILGCSLVEPDAQQTAPVPDEAVFETAQSPGLKSPDGKNHPPPGGDRPVEVFVPSSYSSDSPMPLVILLHGLAVTGGLQEDYFQFKPLAEERGFLYAYPTGTLDRVLQHFWNATDACCNFYGSHVDDSRYLIELIREIKTIYRVDERRVYLIGYSNGAFMSHRMACEHADTIAAIAGLAGALFADSDRCQPREPVHILQIHGLADLTILYQGGSLFGRQYPSAQETAQQWSSLNGCDSALVEGVSLNLEALVPGKETGVLKWNRGCKPGGSVELWTIWAGSHLPSFTPEFASRVIDYLFSHGKPE